MVAMSAENRTIKAEPFSGKERGLSKMADEAETKLYNVQHGTRFGEVILDKVTQQQNNRVRESIPEHKQCAKYQRQNAKAGAVLLAAQESEDVILAL